MKVLMANPYPVSFRNSGGVESIIYSLTQELEGRGIETEVVSLSEKEMYLRERLAILPILWIRLRKKKYDIIHAHAWASFLLRNIKDKPTIATSHGTTAGWLKRIGNTLSPQSRIYNRLITSNLERIGFGSAKALTAVSNSVKQELINNYGIFNARVIYNGIDPKETHRVKTDLKDEYGCEHLLLFVGRIARSKGIGVLINALPMLRGYDYKLVIAGTGRDEADMRKLVFNLKLQDKVEFIGSLEGRRKLEYLSASDVFVFPSLSESFGLALLDAMACEVPIVASNVASIPEILGDCGILPNPERPELLASGIKYMLNYRKDAKRRANRAYERFKDKFTSEKMASEYIKVYNEVM